MLVDMPATVDSEPTAAITEPASATGAWFETALTVTFAAAAVLFASFVAVITGLV
jgi:hypothetical protein